MVYSCWLSLTVLAKDGEAVFSRQLDLPFVPIAGMNLVFNDSKSTFFCADSIEYSVEQDCFWMSESRDYKDCTCAPEGEFCDELIRDCILDTKSHGM